MQEGLAAFCPSFSLLSQTDTSFVSILFSRAGIERGTAGLRLSSKQTDALVQYRPLQALYRPERSGNHFLWSLEKELQKYPSTVKMRVVGFLLLKGLIDRPLWLSRLATAPADT